MSPLNSTFFSNVSACSVEYEVTRINPDDFYSLTSVTKVIYHENYKPGNGYVNDVAVLKVYLYI